MSPIKVNYTGFNGKRTSTTINWNIGFYYWLSITPEADRREGGKIPPVEWEIATKKAVQEYINQRKEWDKDLIETVLMMEITKYRE